MIVVMAVAMVVTLAGFRVVRRRAKPLIRGAALFGIAWVWRAYARVRRSPIFQPADPPIVLFAAAMAAGMVACNLRYRRRATTNASAPELADQAGRLS